MALVIIIAIIVLIVMKHKGVFRKTAVCRHCGKVLKGTEQVVMGAGASQYILCRDCAAKISPVIFDEASADWSYEDYADYLVWEEETKEERAQFHETDSYGFETKLAVDADHGLFSLMTEGNRQVFRFADLTDYTINFKEEVVDDGLLESKVLGKEYISVDLVRPKVYLERVLNAAAGYSTTPKGRINRKYEYDLTDAFEHIIKVFDVCFLSNSSAGRMRTARASTARRSTTFRRPWPSSCSTA